MARRRRDRMKRASSSDRDATPARLVNADFVGKAR
jgi:hypothetical protein